ncbi:hypothetical protein G7Y89_g15559 [Cudoniella acicularis]|uniref:Arb2 domain-containing protein n=1 Tax=Cudoniella acicularis TaxID=354080 RepID=A0A8H4QL12_9HELO|nr:hypothetical protein G7Y89_g15559 [Cudoniella acicularis]
MQIEVIRNIVTTRLLALGLEKILLPFDTPLTSPHLPILVSHDIAYAKRVVVLFYEHTQDLGIIAHRVIGGQGGINSGSAINFVSYIQSQKDPKGLAPGIILANTGQLRWHRASKRALTQTSWFSLPSPSAVSPPLRFNPAKNTIPQNANTTEHISYIFNAVIPRLVNPSASISLIGVSESAYQLSLFIDDFTNFPTWSQRITSFASLGTYFHSSDIKNAAFADWFEKKGRAYIVSSEPSGTFLAGPRGRKKVEAHGCPVFSLGEPYYSEMLLVRGYKAVLDWMAEVGYDRGYENPKLERLDFGGEGDDEEAEEVGWIGEGG